VGGGCDGRIEDMLIFGGSLYATGQFLSCGTQHVNHIASFIANSDGTFEWDSLNTGLQLTIRWLGLPLLNLIMGKDTSVGGFKLVQYRNGLVVGGTFQEAGGVLTGPIAYWDAGAQSWSALQSPCGASCAYWGLRPKSLCPTCCPENNVINIPPTATITALTSTNDNLYVLYIDMDDVYQSSLFVEDVALSTQIPQILNAIAAMWDGSQWIRLTPQSKYVWTGIRPPGSLFWNTSDSNRINMGNDNAYELLNNDLIKIVLVEQLTPAEKKKRELYPSDRLLTSSNPESIVQNNFLFLRGTKTPNQGVSTWDNSQQNYVDSYFGVGYPSVFWTFADLLNVLQNLPTLPSFAAGITVMTNPTNSGTTLKTPLRLLMEWLM